MMEKVYPEMSSFRVGLKSRALYGYFGIKFRLFENTRALASEKEIDWNNKVKERLKLAVAGEEIDVGINPEHKEDRDPNLTEEQRKALDEKDKTLTEDAKNKFSTKLKNAAKTARERFLRGENISIDMDKAALEAAEQGAKGAATGAVLGYVGTLGDVCDVKRLLVAIEYGAKALRAAPLLRYTGLIFGSADDLKAGRVKNGNELSALMKQFDGFDKSGAWRRLTGERGAKIKTGEKFRVDGKAVGKLADINDAISGIPGANTSCKVIGNVFVQAGGAIASVAIAIGSAGTSKGTEIVVGAAVGVITGLAISIAEPIAINLIAGLTLTTDEPPDEKADALVAGAAIMTEGAARVNGEPAITQTEAAALKRTIAAEERAARQKMSLASRFFDIHDPKSTISKLVMRLPSSTDAMLEQTNTTLASLNPLNTQFMASIGSVFQRFTGTAQADENESVESYYGVAQYGFTDEQLDKYPDVLANEEYILSDSARAQRFDEYVKKCMLPDSSIENLEKDDCRKLDDEKLRFSLYYFDHSLMQGLATYEATE
jgi:hypothetical protein